MNRSAEHIDRQIASCLKILELVKEEGRKDFLYLIERFRQDVLLALLDTGELNSSTQEPCFVRIRTLAGECAQRLEHSLCENQRRVFVKGIQLVDKTLAAAGRRVVVPYLPSKILDDLRTYNRELIATMTERAYTAITVEIGLAVLGRKPLEQIARSIGRASEEASIFQGVTHRAETIHRTETNRIQNIAVGRRIAQVRQHVPDLRKEWHYSHAGADMPGHLRLDGAIINGGEKFSLCGVDGVDYYIECPHDPSLPAEETVGCGCWVVGRV